MLALRELDTAGIAANRMALREPSLDDVFLSLTGRRAEITEEEES
jgi:ABC-2 type transport system ATP-binding protein